MTASRTRSCRRPRAVRLASAGRRRGRPVRQPSSSVAAHGRLDGVGRVVAAERECAAASPPTGSCRSGWPCPGRRCPGRCRGSARTGRTCRARSARSPSDADGSIAERPGEHAGLVGQDVAEQVLGDDDVEPGRLLDQQHRARIDELVAEPRRPGTRGAAPRRPSATAARSRARWPCRRWSDGAAPAAGQLEREPDDAARSRAPSTAACRARVRAPGSPDGFGPVAEVEPAGQLADDQHVDAGEQLGADRRRQRRAPGGRVTGRRLANRPSPPRSANSACSGRTRRLRVVPLRPADTRRAGSRRPRRRRPRPRRGWRRRSASIAAPPATCSDQSIAKPNRAAAASTHPPRGRHDLRPDAVARDRGDPVVVGRSLTGGPRAGAATRTPTLTAVDLGAVELVDRHEVGLERRLDDVGR